MNERAPTWVVVLLWIFAIAALANGIAMFFFPSAWFFKLVPGVPETGPFNSHLVSDGGTFNLGIGAGLVYAARDPYRHSVAVLIAAIANIMHSILHVYSHVENWLSMDHIGTEIFGIYLPTLVLTVLAIMLISGREPAAARTSRAT